MTFHAFFKSPVISTAIIAVFLSIVAMPAFSAEPDWARASADACEKGDRSKCLELASAYARGEFEEKKFPKNPSQSQHYIRKGLRLGEQQCGGNDPMACYDIGIMYFEGNMVETDFQRGLDLVKKSCQLGYQKACVWLEDSGLNLGGS